jgi:hypothetical protein
VCADSLLPPDNQISDHEGERNKNTLFFSDEKYLIRVPFLSYSSFLILSHPIFFLSLLSLPSFHFISFHFISLHFISFHFIFLPIPSPHFPFRPLPSIAFYLLFLFYIMTLTWSHWTGPVCGPWIRLPIRHDVAEQYATS